MSLFGASLSEPHTSGTALQDACVCLTIVLLRWVREAIYRKFKLNERKRRYTYISEFKFPHVLCDGSPCIKLNADESTEYERQIVSGARLQRRCHSGSDPPENPIRYASDFDPPLADSIRGINGAIGFLLSTSQSELWCIHADLT